MARSSCLLSGCSLGFGSDSLDGCRLSLGRDDDLLDGYSLARDGSLIILRAPPMFMSVSRPPAKFIATTGRPWIREAERQRTQDVLPSARLLQYLPVGRR